MNRRPVEAWMAEVQARFSAMLRTPLDASRGTLRSNPATYPDGACADLRAGPTLSAAERMGVYHRQYWMRLLRLLQDQHPLTTRLLGAWHFNQHATRFLVSHPPRDRDLAAVVDGFDAFLAEDVRGDVVRLAPSEMRLPRAALLEAARLDAAFRRAFLAPEQPAFYPTAEDEAKLARQRLRFSAAFAIVEEHWPLLQLRAEILGSHDEHALPLPARLAAPRVWALYRTERGMAHVPLSPLHARLFALLEALPVAEALAVLERETPAGARAALLDATRQFFASCVELGFFSGWRDA